MSAAQAAFTIIITIAFIFSVFLFLSLSAFCDNRPQLCFLCYSETVIAKDKHMRLPCGDLNLL